MVDKAGEICYNTRCRTKKAGASSRPKSAPRGLHGETERKQVKVCTQSSKPAESSTRSRAATSFTSKSSTPRLIPKFDKVVALGTDDGFKAGTPYVDGATVTAKVLKNGKAKKVTVATYKPKKNEKRKLGHRQPYTKVEISAINA